MPALKRAWRRLLKSRLPAMTTWPEDGGPFITLPLVFTQHPDGRGHNLGMYRLQVHDARSTGMHWQIGKGGGFHYQVAEARGFADSFSLRLKLHNAALHLKSAPHDAVARAVFDAAETARVEALGSRGYAGIAANLNHALDLRLRVPASHLVAEMNCGYRFILDGMGICADRHNVLSILVASLAQQTVAPHERRRSSQRPTAIHMYQ